MAKIILWIVVVFVVLFGLRLLNLLASSKRRAGRTRRAKSGKAKPPAKQMVRCLSCGVFLPQVEATPVAKGPFVCGDAQCIGASLLRIASSPCPG